MSDSTTTGAETSDVFKVTDFLLKLVKDTSVPLAGFVPSYHDFSILGDFILNINLDIFENTSVNYGILNLIEIPHF